MALRSRSKARSDPDDDAASVLQPLLPVISLSSDDEEGNEDLSLEIIAKARRREGHRGSNSEFVSLLSSDEEVDDEAVVEIGEERKKQKKKRRKPKKKQQQKQKQEEVVVEVGEKEPQIGGDEVEQIGTNNSVLTEEVDSASDNVVLRKLLRGPRYFDPRQSISETCFNCGEEGHVAANCTKEKRKKPCFVCGLFGHNARQCTQVQDCFVCKKKGHMAKDCPEKHKRNAQVSAICLRCGDLGHEMLGCINDYPADDMKEIQCYICKHYGHLCCADFVDSSPKVISCYNCAQCGHTGSGCAKQRGESSTVAGPTLCYKCGEEGHFARGCTNKVKSDRFRGESSMHSRKKDKGSGVLFGIRSAPHYIHKPNKRKSTPFEERREMSDVKSRIRGGWIVDDPGDLLTKKLKSNGWPSPSTPKWPNNSHHLSSDGDYSSPRSSKKQMPWYASPGSTFSASTRKHEFLPLRFANSHARLGHS